MAEISKNERLLNLVAFLLKAHRPVGLPEIRRSIVGYRDARTGESMARRFERDKAILRELGVPLTFVAGAEGAAGGYVLPREAYFLPRLQFSPAEAAILALAGRFALPDSAGPVADAIHSAMLKLQFDSPIPGQIRETAEERFLIHRLQACGALREQENLRVLTSAVLGRRIVSFRYYGIGQDRSRVRKVEPYGIGFSDGHWYLVGRDRGRREIRVFRTDRIRNEVVRALPEGAKPEFEVPEDFRVQDHVGVPPWLFGTRAVTPVRIHFDATVAFMVRMQPAPGDAWEERPDGSAILKRQAAQLDALLNWVLGFARHAEVLDPPEFRQRVADALHAMAATHVRRLKREAAAP